VDILELDRVELEIASRGDVEIASLLLESVTARAQFLERWLLWQFTTPVRSLVCEGIRKMTTYHTQAGGR
jgi:hypothetical protein